MKVVRVQAHRWPKATAEQSDIEGGSYAPEKREGRSSAAPREAASSTALFRTGIGIIPGTTD
jgi:hypothetical protein